MFTTQGTSTRSVLTGIAILLTGCLALAGAAQAEIETTPIAMAVDPATFQGEAPILASWSADSSRYAARYSEATWTETFGQPAEAPTATVQTASFTPAPALERSVVTLPAAKPLAAYRVHVNEHVRFFLDRFQTGYRRAVVEGWLVRSGRYLPMILEVFRQKGLPEDLVFTVMIESGFNPVAVSQAGAKGLWQFMAPTARLYGLRVDGWLNEPLAPEKSTVAAANYLRDLCPARFRGSGPGRHNTGDGKIQQVIDCTGSRDFWAPARARPCPTRPRNFVPDTPPPSSAVSPSSTASAWCPRSRCSTSRSWFPRAAGSCGWPPSRDSRSRTSSP
jgi:soluble lytic murein transglycosylase-like protein